MKARPRREIVKKRAAEKARHALSHEVFALKRLADQLLAAARAERASPPQFRPRPGGDDGAQAALAGEFGARLQARTLADDHWISDDDPDWDARAPSPQ